MLHCSNIEEECNTLLSANNELIGTKKNYRNEQRITKEIQHLKRKGL